MDRFFVSDSQLIKVAAEGNINFHCIVCNAEFLTRTERNEHLETHFVHRNCKDCSRQVIVIGDLEFELHQPIHCKPNEVIDDDGRVDLFEVYETNDNHSSDDEQLLDAKLFDEQQNLDGRSEPEKNDKGVASENNIASKVKIQKPVTEQIVRRQSLRRAVKRNSINVKNESQLEMKDEQADDSEESNTDIDDNVIKNMDRAMKRRRNKNLPKTVPCTVCDAMFSTERSLNIHRNKKHGIKERYICPICSRELESSAKLKRHVEKHPDYKRYMREKKKNEQADGSQESSTDSDDDVIKEMDKAMKRRRNRDLPKIVPCTMCDSMYSSERTLKIHMNKKHGIKERYICPICSHEFKISGNLKQHIETHTDHKRYVCDWCGKGFHLPHNLKEHMNTHTGAKPYKCETCGKMFGRINLRQAHMRIHTGEKPYKCNQENCDRAYAYKTDLKRHQRSVHGIITKTFPCPICSKVFYENKFLTKHLNVHRGKI